MSYIVHRQCECGRKYQHASDTPDPKKCPVCKPTKERK